MYIVYSKENCPFCVKAKNLLEIEDLEYVVIDLADNPEDLEWLVNMGCRSAPQIFKMEEEGITLDANHRIGGYDDLVKHVLYIS